MQVIRQLTLVCSARIPDRPALDSREECLEKQSRHDCAAQRIIHRGACDRCLGDQLTFLVVRYSSEISSRLLARLDYSHLIIETP